MAKVVNIERCFEKFNDTFSPKIVGNVNGQDVKVVRLEGDKVPWHTHDKEDEMFFVIEGTLDVYETDKTITLQAGEFYIVKRGLVHKVVPLEHVKLILVESEGISHTGDVKSGITLESYDWLDV
jgi:quercetin dioxygenase-like cupin family protein